MEMDLMVIGAHPDDIEIGIGGTIAKYSQSKKSVILVDLTSGEMGSNGNSKIRKEEAERASKILGADKRINLAMKDRNILVNSENIKKLVDLIRTYRPKVLFYPYKKDYHPDHEAAYRLVREAIHTSGLSKYVTCKDKYRPQEVYNYYINDIEEVSRFVDISSVYAIKQKALAAHESQFKKTHETIDTYLNEGFIENVGIRDRYWGMKSGCQYAEVLYTHKLAEFVLK